MKRKAKIVKVLPPPDKERKASFEKKESSRSNQDKKAKKFLKKNFSIRSSHYGKKPNRVVPQPISPPPVFVPLNTVKINNPPVRGDERTLDVIIFTYEVKDSFLSCVYSEARVANNFAWMLCLAGHNVTLVCCSNFDGRFANELPGLTIIERSEVDLLKKYDVCFSTLDIPEVKQIKCEMCLWIMFYGQCDRKADSSLYKDKRYCFVRDVKGLFDEYKHVRIEDSPEQVKKETCFLPTPIPDIDFQYGFDCNHLTWASKHIGYLSEIPLVSQAKMNLFEALRRLGNKYKTHFGTMNITDRDMVNSVNNIPNVSYTVFAMGYNEVINRLAKSKLCLGCPINGSFEEAILHNCIPLVWKGSKDIYPSLGKKKGGSSVAIAAEKIGYGFDIKDNFETILRKLDLILNDKGYYDMVLNTFEPIGRKFTFRNSYEVFLDVLGGGAGEEYSRE